MLERQLTSIGYAAVVASAPEAPRVIAQFEPDVLLVALHNGTDGERLALARRLRAEASTHALPVVFLYHRDEGAHRAAALNLGADDYFPLASRPAELAARLDALSWRAEAGRRAAPSAGERRAEIDNFMLLIDAVRDDARDAERGGALALVEAVSGEAGGAQDRRTLGEAHGFLKLNLRRADSIAFYGPTTLLIYMPGRDREEARAALARLREEFKPTRPGADIAAGVVSFPADGAEVETLIEKAETAVASARSADAPRRVLAYEPEAGGVAVAGEPATALTFEEKPAASHASHGQAPSAQAPSGGSAPRVELPATQAPGGSRRRQPQGDATEEWTRRAAEAGERELERRARGEVMPRRLLLAVSDPLRMSRLNLLARAAGYQVRAAFDGHQALNLLRIERPDLLVLDRVLEDMDGLEALRRLNQQFAGARNRLPVVLLADGSGAGEALRREATEAGASAVASLSSDPFDFLATIRRAGGVE